MKYKLMIITTLLISTLTACQNNNIPYDFTKEQLEQAKDQAANKFIAKSKRDQYQKEDIEITEICKAEHDLNHDGVEYIFKYETSDRSYNSTMAYYKKDKKFGTTGTYKIIEDTCKVVNF